ncbi:O-methyltransferase-domain-containing protein [Exophiala viscosa]|uniref:O-methyltransferase-domain-containing protein n=1 Tax=Exophiala viscosa TaxID=2486360 RepID=A0AAN6DYP7_9EURO|nr:O-methyltransferase-domain-containing protein [Exophiala viscosa]KAI1624044.1 O-methyltransferase-domain-containing protein [Exophiala viscosa]
MAPPSLPSYLDPEVLPRLLENVNEHVQALSSGDLKARDAAIEACRTLASTLESPSEAFVRMTWVEPSHLSSMRVALGMGLFEQLAADSSSPKSSAQLAALCSADPRLVEKTLKVLAAVGTVREVDADSYASSPLSQSMTRSIFSDSLSLMHDFCIPINLKTADFFAQNGYKYPADPLSAPAQFAHNVMGKTHVMQLYEEHDQAQKFGSMMATWMLGRPHWSDNSFYPVQERLIQGATGEHDSVFLVDVGGSTGHDLSAFLALHPLGTFPGHLVVQDRAEVIDTIPKGSLSAGIQPMAHDFFTPQPVQGARAYFLHNIIHDWDDDKARAILKNLAAAMKKGYSKLLLWEYVLPAKNSPPTLSALDWEMMSFWAASERSDGHWRRILEDPEIGLKVNGFWSYSQYDQTVIEAELA